MADLTGRRPQNRYGIGLPGPWHCHAGGVLIGAGDDSDFLLIFARAAAENRLKPAQCPGDWRHVLRFAEFEFHPQRNELRGPDGEAIKLRPQASDMLLLFANNAGRVFSKQQLLDAIWPDVHVGEDNLFQRIREIRTALGDHEHQLIKLVRGRGYVFEAEVRAEPASETALAGPARVEPVVAAEAAAGPAKSWRPLDLRRPAVLAALAGLAAMVVLAIAVRIVWPEIIQPRRLAIAVAPIAGADAETAATAAAVTVRLADGLARIENIRVVTPDAAPGMATSAPADRADFRLSGELQKTDGSWELRARLIRTASGEMMWTAPVSVAIGETDPELQQSRLAAGLGHLLALRLNELTQAGAPATTADGRAKVVIEQARVLLNQTNQERFAAAQALLEKALAENPDDVDLGVALAALQLRGIQMVWYTPEQSAEAGDKAKAVLERATRVRPDSIAVLEAYCRLLNATNYFVESLVACARTLSFDPWDGLVLFHIGLAQLQLGLFEDALATFKQADRYDTPQVSRWTWPLGAGMTLLLMDRSEEAVPWLQRSLAITPGSGRTNMLLSAAYERLGRPDEAKAAMAKAMALRPGSNLGNAALPPKNASPIFVAASERIGRAYLAAGLPER
jgi:DNA-binding winged helix-turn-helix (wHTH) protein/tetratricopeptide (TPR) repeat protein